MAQTATNRLFGGLNAILYKTSLFIKRKRAKNIDKRADIMKLSTQEAKMRQIFVGQIFGRPANRPTPIT